eukprot:gene8873-biopygen2774
MNQTPAKCEAYLAKKLAAIEHSIDLRSLTLSQLLSFSKVNSGVAEERLGDGDAPEDDQDDAQEQLELHRADLARGRQSPAAEDSSEHADGDGSNDPEVDESLFVVQVRPADPHRDSLYRQRHADCALHGLAGEEHEGRDQKRAGAGADRADERSRNVHLRGKVIHGGASLSHQDDNHEQDHREPGVKMLLVNSTAPLLV